MSRTKLTGDRGENAARRYLEMKGYVVHHLQWRCRAGEIDIVAQDGETLVFVEVKTRHAQDAGTALEMITPAKRRRLIESAYAYIASIGQDDAVWRIDAVAVLVDGRDDMRITHVENVLDW